MDVADIVAPSNSDDAAATLTHDQRMVAARERIHRASTTVLQNRHSVRELIDTSPLDAQHYAQQAEQGRESMERQRAAIDEEFQRMMQEVHKTSATMGVVDNNGIDAASEVDVSQARAEEPAPAKRPRSQSRRTTNARGNGTSRMGGSVNALRAKARARRLPVQTAPRGQNATHSASNAHGDVGEDTGDAPEIPATPTNPPDTSLMGIVRRATRTQHRINYSSRVLGDKLGLHCLSHQSIVALKRDARPLAALVRNVGQTLRDVAQGGASAHTQLESTLCDMLHKTLSQWHTTIQECSTHMQRTQRFLEAMYGHMHQLTDDINSIQASFLQRQCHVADAAGHRAILQGMIERRNALESEINSGEMHPTQLWGTATQVQQLPMFAASRDICSTHASNSFKGINVEFAPRRRNSAAGGSRRARGGSKAGNGTTKSATRRTKASKSSEPSTSTPSAT